MERLQWGVQQSSQNWDLTLPAQGNPVISYAGSPVAWPTYRNYRKFNLPPFKILIAFSKENRPGFVSPKWPRECTVMSSLHFTTDLPGN